MNNGTIRRRGPPRLGGRPLRTGRFQGPPGPAVPAAGGRRGQCVLRKPVADTLADDPGERGGRLLVPLAGPGRSCGRLDPKGVAAKARPRPDRDTFPDDPGRAGVRRPEGTAIDLTKDKPAFPGRPRGKSPGNGPRDAFGLFPGGPVRDPATVKAFNPPGGE